MIKKCQTCSKETMYLQKHHIVPKSLGGTDFSGNLIEICEKCHGIIHGSDFTNHKVLTKAAMSRKRSRNEKTGGVIPFGYSLDENNRLITLNSEINTIERICQLRATGFSLRDIVADLQANGIKTKTGRERWNPKVVKQILDRRTQIISSAR